MADETGQGTILRVVVEWEPAIVWPPDRAAREKQAIAYRKTRDFDSLRFIEGKRPRVFVTKRLARTEMRDIRGLALEPHQQEVAFACGVTHVEQPDGSIVRPASGRWSKDELDMFDDATVAEIGTIVLEVSRPPLGLRPVFAGLHSSAVALGAWLYPNAGLSPDGALPNKSGPEAQSGT